MGVAEMGGGGMEEGKDGEEVGMEEEALIE